MSVVHNERTKLLANALDRGSTACIAVGIFGPAVAVLYDVAGASATRGALFAVGSVFWLSAAAVLHLAARYVLAETEMSGMWLFANVVLPVVVVAMGLAAVVLHGRAIDREDRSVPGE